MREIYASVADFAAVKPILWLVGFRADGSTDPLWHHRG